jgi:BirA family transcriptional regulator, biotin operon repressor / biotin---[acetyl-CoA-carboxylase] ligase
VTPPGTSVTCTFAIRTHVAPVNFGWFPLLAGLAAVRALRAVADVDAVLKWPNDVLLPADSPLDGWGALRKVGGILSQVAAVGPGSALGLGEEDPTDAAPLAGSTILLGIGLNVLQEPDELPVESATSVLATTGRRVAREDVLVALAGAVVDVLTEWRDAGRDPARSTLPAEVAAVCATLGQHVRVELPGDAQVDGVAERIAADGSLVVVDDSGAAHTVLAGDVRHVRTPG